MGLGGSKKVTTGYKYYMSVMMGLCRGPIDEINEIRVGDVKAFPYDKSKVPIYAPGDYHIDASQIFGGDKKEGGIEGRLTVMMGEATQVAPSFLKSLLGGSSPDFRGVATLLFNGLICSNNPYPKKWKFRLRRTLKGWDGPVWQPDLATIWLDQNRIRAMNPAHILYECATNRDWGRGFPRSRINEAAWLKAAQKLYDESFGLCIRWNRQESLQNFVQTVLDHIGGGIYIDRETGLITLQLLRDDYVPSELPSFDYNSGLLSVDDGETASIADAVNEVVIKYHSPLDDEDREVRAQNLASIQTLGAVNSTSKDYFGLATFDLASRIAQRDLRINTAGGRRYKVKLDRRAWRIFPGAVFRVSAPDKGISNLVLRAGKVTDGPLTNGEIAVEAVLDVFGLAATSFVSQQDSQWVPPDTTPVVASVQQVREATYRDFVLRVSPADLALVDVHSGGIATLAAKPSSLSLNYSIATRTGTNDFLEYDSESFAPALELSASIGPYDSEIYFEYPTDLGLFEVDDLLQLGDEILQVKDILVAADGDNGLLTVTRGCLDTIPAPHYVGDHAIFISDVPGTDGLEYVAGETVDVKLLTVTSTGVLPAELVETHSVLIVGRQGRPYPPGAVKINDQQWFNVQAVTGALTVAWQHRDRVVQQDQIIDHFSASVGPEPGTTYNLRVYNADTRQLLRAYTNINGNSIVVETDLVGNLLLRLESVRQNLTSLQTYETTIARS